MSVAQKIILFLVGLTLAIVGFCEVFIGCSIIALENNSKGIVDGALGSILFCAGICMVLNIIFFQLTKNLETLKEAERY